MRTFQINAGIPQNNVLVSILADGTSNLKAIALKLMLLTSLFTRAVTLVFTLVSQSLWFTDKSDIYDKSR